MSLQDHIHVTNETADVDIENTVLTLPPRVRHEQKHLADINDDNTLHSIPEITEYVEETYGEITFLPGTTGDKPQFRLIALRDLAAETKFQRYLTPTVVKKAKQFNYALARPPVVYARPDGSYSIIDGQHTCVMAYKGNGADFEINCEVHEHPKDRSIVDCLKKEAEHFDKLNTARKNLSKLETIRAGLLYDVEEAIKFNNMLSELRLHIEGLGDTSFFGYRIDKVTKLEWAVAKFDKKYVRQAVDFLRDVDEKHWKRGHVNGSLIMTMSAVFKLLDELNGGKRGKALATFLDKHFHNTSPNEWNKASNGTFGYIIVARRLVDAINMFIKNGVIEGASIGDGVLEQSGLGDPSKFKKDL